ncbi:MAG: site-specific DNA-methyltransferase [Selenomonadaceae bacterium]|nr:site-specific DNA-methyltransferase [Selenomonadaceae bacterium]
MIEPNNIYLGDSRVLLDELADDSIDCVISDIPYGIGVDYWDVLHDNSNSALLGASPAQVKAGKVFKSRGKPLNGWSEADKQIPQAYYNWCRSWTDKLFRVVKPGASLLVFAGRRLAHRAVCAFEDSGFIFKDMLAWDKEKSAHRAQHLSKIYERRGDFISANKWSGWKVGNLRPLFEPIMWLMKPYKLGGTIADNVLQYGLGAYNENVVSIYGQSPNNIVNFSATKGDTGLHPTQKPLNLMKYLVELVSIEGQVVLDPFVGSGSTLLACKELDRRFIGFECNEDFFATALQRVDAARFVKRKMNTVVEEQYLF